MGIWNFIQNQVLGMSRVIVETALESFAIDPSYGTHFFHNVTSLGIGYFTVSDLKHEGHIDWAWLDSLPAMRFSEGFIDIFLINSFLASF